MSTTYSAVAGDTFETVARKVYGSETYATNLRQANPEVQEPIAPGVRLFAPAIPGQPQDKQTQAPSQRIDEPALLIDGTRFRYWTDIDLTRSLDGMDSLTFGAPFEPDSSKFRETFRPFTYKPLAITVGGDPLFNGTLVGVTPDLQTSQRTVSVSGYSLPGVLNDCTPSASSYPVEFNNQTLSSIASSLCTPFGVGVRFDAPVGPAFERVAVEPGTPILRFLVDLAQQRGLVLTSTERGELLFQQSVEPGSPVARLVEGESPVLGVSPAFNPQQYYSHVTALESTVVGSTGAKYTARNPLLSGTLRPHVFSSPDVEEGGAKQAAEAKLGRMFGDMVSYTVQLDTWRDADGELWQPNTTLSLDAPGAMIYGAYEFVIRKVRLSRQPSKKTAELTLVLPGSFNGDVPEALPWDS